MSTPLVTRFAGLPRAAAVAVLAALAILIALGAPTAGRLTPLQPSAQSPDIQYYREVTADVRAGKPYTISAVERLRERHAATRPFFTIRPPLLTTFLARLPGDGERLADLLLAALAAVTICAWLWRLSSVSRDGAYLARSGLILLASVAIEMRGNGLSFIHETWAGLLIAGSLAVRSDRRFVLSAALALAAALIRELAMPFVAVMAGAALIEGRKGEAAAFACALAVAGVALALHAVKVDALTVGDLPVAAGWVKLGGWAFVLETTRWSYLAIPWLGCALVPLAVIGATGWKDSGGVRLSAVIGGYTLGLLVVGRPDNFYWGLMVAPLIGVGLALAPEALVDLARRAFLRPAFA